MAYRSALTRIRAVLGCVTVAGIAVLPVTSAGAASSTRLQASGTHGTASRTTWTMTSDWTVPASAIDVTSTGTVLLILSRGAGTEPLVVLSAYRPLPGQPFDVPASYFTGTGATDSKGVLRVRRGPLTATLWCSRICTVTLPHLPVGGVVSRRQLSGVQAIEQQIPSSIGQVPALRIPISSSRPGVWLVTSAVLHGAQPRSAAAMQACRDSTPAVCDANQGQELAESAGLSPSGVGVVLTRQSTFYVSVAGPSSALHAAVATQATYARATLLFCPL